MFNGPDGKQGTKDDFDAILHLGNANANVPAKAGYPSVAVPGGFNALSTLTPADPPIAVPFPSDITFCGPRVLGAEADRVGVCVRASDEASRAAREHAAAAERRHSRATLASLSLEPEVDAEVHRNRPARVRELHLIDTDGCKRAGLAVPGIHVLRADGEA